MRSKEELYRTPYSELTKEELIQLINYGLSEKNQLKLDYQDIQHELELTRKDLSRKEEFIKSLSNLVKAVKEIKSINLY